MLFMSLEIKNQKSKIVIHQSSIILVAPESRAIASQSLESVAFKAFKIRARLSL
jgi:hypothetical protein